MKLKKNFYTYCFPFFFFFLFFELLGVFLADRTSGGLITLELNIFLEPRLSPLDSEELKNIFHLQKPYLRKGIYIYKDSFNILILKKFLHFTYNSTVT